MGGQDKLSATIAGRPLLRWAVEAFAATPNVRAIVVVTSDRMIDALSASTWLTRLGVRLVIGGDRRQDSVSAGVRATSADIVLVHDAARPLVSPGLIGRVIACVRERGAAIPVLPVVDALKRIDGDADGGLIAASIARSGLFRAQTPQGAHRDVLLAAIGRHAHRAEDIPDEAELLALDGVAVATVLGETTNLKVTIPEDLALARTLATSALSARTAVGIDSHPFGPGDGLRLGGVLIDAAPRLYGHSDGDVVLHAVCDGLLAAAGVPDLGRLFPAGDPTTRDIDSQRLLADVLTRLAAGGVTPDSIDVTITGARPRLGGARLDAIAVSIAALTDLPRSSVSVKAGTGNLSGEEGAGRAMSASCLVRVVKR
jgi:2-C-methyl-D-erythritol 4-phosphate cytidylyltransferase/2-C-methyl-D-erythritol 2,4-cyclodiphosphate synthase